MARPKPRIYRAGPRDWRVVKPRAGFGPTTEETQHPSFTDAVDSMVVKAQHYVSGFESEIRSYQLGDHLVRGIDGDWRF